MHVAVPFFIRSKSALHLLLLGGAVCACASAVQRSSAQTPAPPQPDSITAAPSAPGAPPQKLPRVTTTVVVHDNVKDEYLSDAVTVGTLDNSTLAETPLAVSVMTRELLNDQDAGVLSDVGNTHAWGGE